MSEKRKARKRGGEKEEEDKKPQLEKGKKAVCTWIR